MKKSPAETILSSAVELLSEFLPNKSYLYFPLLSSSLSWAIKRTKEWKENIFSWEVWPDPGIVEVKSEEFIYSFFKNNSALDKAYRDEIKRRDFSTLRQAFSRLYPVIGLEDPFLSAFFHQELKTGEFRKIVKEFDAKVSQAREDVETIQAKTRLLEGLKTFADEMVSIGSDLFSRKDVQKAVKELVKKNNQEK